MQSGSTMFTLGEALSSVEGRDSGTFQSFEIWLGDTMSSGSARRTCADIYTAGLTEDGYYWLYPSAHQEIKAWCSMGNTLLAKVSAGAIGYMGGEVSKLTNVQMWTLLRTKPSLELVRSINYQGAWYSGSWTISDGFYRSGSDRYLLYQGQWNGHSAPPAFSDGGAQMVFSEIDPGSNYNYPMAGLSHYNLPGALPSACGCSSGSFNEYEMWLSGGVALPHA